ncbi:MAG: hypothetical protein ACK4UR_06440, partial [Caldimicrobium sp.]
IILLLLMFLLYHNLYYLFIILTLIFFVILRLIYARLIKLKVEILKKQQTEINLSILKEIIGFIIVLSMLILVFSDIIIKISGYGNKEACITFIDKEGYIAEFLKLNFGNDSIIKLVGSNDSKIGGIYYTTRSLHIFFQTSNFLIIKSQLSNYTGDKNNTGNKTQGVQCGSGANCENASNTTDKRVSNGTTTKSNNNTFIIIPTSAILQYFNPINNICPEKYNPTNNI